MIFASVGTNKLPFDRFVKAIDELAPKLKEEVIIQIGHSNYKPKYAKYFEFCDLEKMLYLIQSARIVIAHAGFGIIGDCIQYKKRLILIPREFRFKEAVDNQVELAEYLSKNTNGIICLRDVSKLEETIKIISKINPNYKYKTKIPRLIKDFIDNNIKINH